MRDQFWSHRGNHLIVVSEAVKNLSAAKIIDARRAEGVGDTWAVVAWTINSAITSVIHTAPTVATSTPTAQSLYAVAETCRTKHIRCASPT
jgi:hypothetical protein